MSSNLVHPITVGLHKQILVPNCTLLDLYELVLKMANDNLWIKHAVLPDFIKHVPPLNCVQA
jgi:hypothetical protein